MRCSGHRDADDHDAVRLVLAVAAGHGACKPSGTPHDDRSRAAKAQDAPLPAAGEIAGAASAVFTVRLVSDCRTELQHFLPPGEPLR
jgi:hypothetical protein